MGLTAVGAGLGSSADQIVVLFERERKRPIHTFNYVVWRSYRLWVRRCGSTPARLLACALSASGSHLMVSGNRLVDLFSALAMAMRLRKSELNMLRSH
jgi:hypothetical protein